MTVPDTLSRAYPHNGSPCEVSMVETDVSMLDYLSVSEEKYAEFQHYTQQELGDLIHTINSGWPDHRSEVTRTVQPYWNVRSELAMLDGIVYRGMGIVVPPSLQRSMLQLIHQTHMGIVKSKQRAWEVLYQA